MIDKPLPYKGLTIRIPIIIPVKGRGFVNQGSGVILAVAHIITSLAVWQLYRVKSGNASNRSVLVPYWDM